MKRRLDLFILSIATLVAVFVFGGVYFILYKGIQRVAQRSAYEQARTVARQTFSDMFQVMRRGWKRKELMEFLKGIEDAHKETGTSVKVYRGDIVKKLFGNIKEPERSSEVKKSFKEKESVIKMEGNVLVYTYPLIAREECLRCHVNAKKGDILGVIEVRQNLSIFTASMKRGFLVLALFTLPFPILGAFFVVFVIKGKLQSSLEKLNSAIEEVHKVSDLSRIDVAELDFGFEELDQIKGSLARLVDRMKNIAVDKDILEFEIRLLEKFIITSEAITDWKGFLKDILDDVSHLIKFMYFYVIFREAEEEFSVYIFWNFECAKEQGTPCREVIEKDILENLKKTDIYVEGASVNFNHEELDYKILLEECPVDRIRIFSKSLLLEKPLVGGAVGIGVSLDESESDVKKLAIEGLLATILNIIGSIKAINKYTEELEYYATRDPLTNLYNQRVFWELLDYEVERARRHGYRFSLFIVDIDNFKLVNDTYGHGFGDEFLRGVAGVLTEIFRKEDIIARYGGDEFTVVVPYAGPTEAEAIAKRLISAFEKFSMPSPDGKAVKVTASVGIAVFPDHGETSKEIFVLADDMMYRAKKEGKNRYKIVSDEELAEIKEDIAEKSFMILETLEKKSIIPFFQPIMDVRNGKIRAYEVLMRIEHGGKIVPAGEFISVAENIGVIHRLDYILIEKALERVKERGCQPILFFNLSPKAIILSEFISNVRNLINTAGYDPERIVFEITERETVRNLEMLKKFVEALKLEGFKFAVDDFGSGFASFTYLKMFPIDVVKIEGDFIRSMLTSEIDRAFVESAVSMAKALGIETVAEYVEDEDILQAVKSAGVDLVQGYYVGKPSREVCHES